MARDDDERADDGSSASTEPALHFPTHGLSEKSCVETLADADSAAPSKNLYHEKGTLRRSLSPLPTCKGSFYGVQKGTGIGKHTYGRVVGRACKLAHLEVAAERVGHALLTSPRLLRSPARKKSPIRWFPRKKTESYLERKIRMLRAKEGNVASLDETLGAAKAHLSRIEREKLAAQAAATEAIDARKGALVEASWCRILKLAEIPCMSAISELQKAEKKAAVAMAEAEAHGVILQPGTSEREHSSEAVTASLETAFDVDKEVTAAIKIALQQLCRSPEKDSELLDESSAYCTSTDYVERIYALGVAESQIDTVSTGVECKPEEQVTNTEMQTPQKILSSSKDKNKWEAQPSLVALMANRIRELSLENQTALAGIVATRGLSALLKDQNLDDELNGRTQGSPKKTSDLGSILVKHVSRLQREVQASKEANRLSQSDVDKKSGGRLQRSVAHVDSLDQILVKHVSKLEKEKLAAQAARKTPTQKGADVATDLAEMQTEHHEQSETCNGRLQRSVAHVDSLDQILVKHVSKLEKEKLAAQAARKTPIQKGADVATNLAEMQTEPHEQSETCNEAKVERKKTVEAEGERLPKSDENAIGTCDVASGLKQHMPNQAALREQELVETQEELLNQATLKDLDSKNCASPEPSKVLCRKESRSGEKIVDTQNQRDSLNAGGCKKIGTPAPNQLPDFGSILVKHVSRLEKEKQMAAALQDKSNTPVRKIEKAKLSYEASLGDVLIKRLSKLEIEKARLSGSGIGSTICTISEPAESIQDSKENSCLDAMPVNNLTGKEDPLTIQSKQAQKLDGIWNGMSLQDAMTSAKSKCIQINTGRIIHGNTPRRKSLREKQMQDEWGGLSLGNALKPHVSKLEKEQATWRLAEEEARRRPNLQR